MTNTDLYSRYIWLIELIYRCDGISRAQINSEWAQSYLNVLGETEIPERTFHRYKIAIKHLFGIEIYSSRSAGSSYHIRDVDRVMADPEMYWLLHSCVIANFLRQYKHLSHRILLERVSGGREHLATITDAMRTDHTLVIEYPDVDTASYAFVEVEPFFLKLNLRRWYLVGRNVATDAIATYSVARIRSIRVTDHPFTMPADFSPAQFFTQLDNIELGDMNTVSHVVLRADHRQHLNLRAMPLHHTQREIASTADSATFALDVDITVEFIQQLLYYGSAIEVLEPPILRQAMARIARRVLARHS